MLTNSLVSLKIEISILERRREKRRWNRERDGRCDAQGGYVHVPTESRQGALFHQQRNPRECLSPLENISLQCMKCWYIDSSTLWFMACFTRKKKKNFSCYICALSDCHGIWLYVILMQVLGFDIGAQLHDLIVARRIVLGFME